jgi:hypothetical protein
MKIEIHDPEAVVRPRCVLVPKLRLGTRSPAKLCFGGGTLSVDTRAYRATELRGISAFPIRVWERVRNEEGNQMDDNFQPVA